MSGEEQEENTVPASGDVTDVMEAHRISSAVLGHYAMLASDDEAQDLRNLLPESRRNEWSFVRSRILRDAARSGWQPINASELLELVQRPQACFIRSNDDLLNFVLLRLKSFAAQAWTVGIKPLWNEPRGRPTAKDETELSNRLKLWLDQSFQLIVNREPQPVELMGKRLDLKVEIPGEPRLCVIVEVKKVENRDVEASMQTQLVDTYLVAGGESHGIYAVAWFGDKAAALAGATAEGMYARLTSLRSALRRPTSVRVECVLMDLRHPLLTQSTKPVK